MTHDPPPTSERAVYVDVLRGFALLGILPANIAAFALPLTWHAQPAPVTGTWWETGAYVATRVLADYKLITLFSLLFGVGLGILHGRVTAQGQRFLPFMALRLSLLFGIGLLHATLLFWGDVLATYALLGLLALLAVDLPPRTLAIAGGVLCAVPAVFLLLAIAPLYLLDGLIAQLGELPSTPHVAGRVTGSWEEFGQGVLAWSAPFEIELATEGSFVRRALVRGALWGISLLGLPFYFGWRIFGLFLLGLALAKDGRFLHPDRHPSLFRRQLGWGLLVGVPLHLGLAAMLLLAPAGLGSTAAQETLLYVGSFGLAAVYAGGLGLLMTKLPAWLFAPLRDVGRTALSGYLLQSALGAAVFGAGGLALFGSLDRLRLWGVVLAFWAVQLGLAWVWLRWFRMGPAEWAWRSLSYRRLQPLRAAPHQR